MSVNVFYDNFFAMGTRFEAVFWGKDASFSASVFEEIRKEVVLLERELSHFDEKSPITALNKNAGVKRVPVPDAVLSAFTLCRRHHELTQGLFDVTIREHSRDSGEEMVAPNGKKISDFSKLTFSGEEKTAFLTERGIRVDLGGIGKGIALHRVEQLLDRYDVEHALVSFGESSILTRGRHPHGPTWKIGISDIHRKDESRCFFELNNHALSTSGVTSRNEGHIYHPHTGHLQRAHQTVSVMTSSPVDAEVLSTALFIADYHDQAHLLNEYQPDRAIRITYDAEGRSRVTEMNQSYFL